MKAVELSKVASILLLCLAGCESVQDKPAGLPDFIHRSADQEPVTKPARMAVIWSEAIYRFPGREAVRGFGGRIYFYDDQHQSVPVQGELIVFAFDDTDKDSASNVPSRKFVYTAEQLAQHYSETELGHSYSVWIPWDAVGGQQKDLTLMPVFRATGGQLVRAEATKNVLPGTDEPEQAIAKNKPAREPREVRFRQAGYERQVDPRSERQANPQNDSSTPRIQATTIPLSAGLTRQLQVGQGSSSGVEEKVNQLAAMARQDALRRSPGNSQISYGQRPEGWNNANVTYGSGPSTSSPNTAGQRQRAAFGAPGPFARGTGNSQVGPHPVNGSNWPRQPSGRSALGTPRAQAGQSVPPNHGHNSNQPFPARQ